MKKTQVQVDGKSAQTLVCRKFDNAQQNTQNYHKNQYPMTQTINKPRDQRQPENRTRHSCLHQEKLGTLGHRLRRKYSFSPQAIIAHQVNIILFFFSFLPFFFFVFWRPGQPRTHYVMDNDLNFMPPLPRCSNAQFYTVLEIKLRAS